MQEEQVNSFLKCSVTQFRASMYMNSRKVQISAPLIQLYSGNGIMPQMLTWATVEMRGISSNNKQYSSSKARAIAIYIGSACLKCQQQKR